MQFDFSWLGTLIVLVVMVLLQHQYWRDVVNLRLAYRDEVPVWVAYFVLLMLVVSLGFVVQHTFKGA